MKSGKRVPAACFKLAFPYVTALQASFFQQLKHMLFPSGVLAPILGTLGTVVCLAWISGDSTNSTAVAYVAIGASLSAVWQSGVLRCGYALDEENNAGTLELMMTTRTPLALVMLGKAMAIIAFASLNGLAISAIVLLISDRPPSIDNVALFLISEVGGFMSVIASTFIFTPFAFMFGVRSGFFNAIMPIGAAIGGFLYPLSELPPVLDVMGHFMPTSWAMEAIIGSMNDASLAGIASELLMGVSLSIALFVATYGLFIKAEHQVRNSGGMR